MKIRRVNWIVVIVTVFKFAMVSSAVEKTTQIYPVAIFQFEERGSAVKGYGKKISDLLFANLVSNLNLYLVDRSELEKLLNEAELNLSGIVSPGHAMQVGQLTGAKIIITGSVMEIDRKLYAVAKIISTETSRVVGVSEKGKIGEGLDTIVERLSVRVGETIVDKAHDLVARIIPREDRLAQLKEKLGNLKRPSVSVTITERHIGQTTIDPAAETEIIYLCKEAGFNVIQFASDGSNQSDVIIKGEGISEFATSRRNLVSVKARVEIKAINSKTGEILATDRQTAVVVDLTEQLAGKAALQKAAYEIAERVLPKLVK